MFSRPGCRMSEELQTPKDVGDSGTFVPDADKQTFPTSRMSQEQSVATQLKPMSVHDSTRRLVTSASRLRSQHSPSRPVSSDVIRSPVAHATEYLGWTVQAYRRWLMRRLAISVAVLTMGGICNRHSNKT